MSSFDFSVANGQHMTSSRRLCEVDDEDDETDEDAPTSVFEAAQPDAN